MADDTIWDFVNGFMSGKISRSVFWEYAKFRYPAQGIIDIFSSFITDEISDFNFNVYYTNPDYLRCSYLEGKMLA